VHSTAFQLSVAVAIGHPGGFAIVVSHGLTLDFALQNRSVEKGAPLRQKPSVQSASERQGEQKPPSPTQTPARGTHTSLDGAPHFCPALQSASDPHSGVHLPLSQCWKVPRDGEQSSSVVHAWPLLGTQTAHGAAHLASGLQSASLPHWGVQ
jgi:hypothetical protein